MFHESSVIKFIGNLFQSYQGCKWERSYFAVVVKYGFIGSEISSIFFVNESPEAKEYSKENQEDTRNRNVRNGEIFAICFLPSDECRAGTEIRSNGEE